jgi:hypothetical protein
MIPLTGPAPLPRIPRPAPGALAGGGAVTEERKDSWTQWVALTTTILAVCAAISSLKGGGYSTRVQLATTVEANTWAYY